ncbi:MAG: tRNA (uridine(34)/cytosine(34)/5-carboxymethylaminomethyluridine(34)-2'-O)-methyltransferase TrmL, partial [Acutalibacteraceae bacterium]
CCVRLPMGEGIRSLNLSNTVAVAAYEVLRQWGYPELQNQGRLTQFDWGSLE